MTEHQPRSIIASVPQMAAQLVGLYAFACLQPVFDLISNNVEFLVAHSVRAGSLVAVLALVALAAPALMVAAFVGLSRLHRGAGASLHSVLAFGLVALIAAAPLAATSTNPIVVVVICGVMGLLAVVAIRHVRLVSSITAAMAVALPAFVLLFWLAPDVRGVLAAGSTGVAVPKDDVQPHDVVFVVFDELPLASLVTADLQIDAESYPNFARLADTSTWYRNATTVSETTHRAIPSLLTGRFPDPDGLPTLSEYPVNLFTVLHDSHRLVAAEPRSDLCPREDNPLSAQVQLDALVQDMSVLYTHLVTPRDWKKHLPSVGHDWRGFAQNRVSEWRARTKGEERPDLFRAGIAQVAAGDRPSVYFLHSVLPHTPYHYYASGTVFTHDPREPSGQGRQNGDWTSDEQAAIHSQQRHLVQARYTDALLGELFERLDQAGMFDDAIIVVTADHGVGFRAGDARRGITATNLGALLHVPLFVKLPRQVVRGIDDRPVLLIDILPTVLDVLGIEREFAADGTTLLNPDHAYDRRWYQGMSRYEAALDETWKQFQETVNVRLNRFEHGVFAPGPWGALVGRAVSPSLPIGQCEVILLDAEQFQTVDPSSGFVPGEIRGLVTADAQDLRLGVVLNGTLRSSTIPYEAEEGRPRAWAVLVPEDAFVTGANRVEVVEIRGTWQSPEFLSTKSDTEASFLGVALGGQRILGVDETGFHNVEPFEGVPSRWTDGAAELSVPTGSRSATAIVLDLCAAGPLGADLDVQVNGQTVQQLHVPPAGWRGRVSIPADIASRSGSIVVALRSSTFVPAEATSNAKDRRVLGVRLRGLTVE